MSDIFTLNEFLTNTAQKDRDGETFQLESNRMLEINVDGQMWIKMGAMVAYRGSLRFEREGVLERGVGQLIKRAVTGEASPLTRATGRGTVYVADSAKHVTLIKLHNESMYVNGNDLLAFEPSVGFEVKMIRRIAGMLAGGLFAVHLTGSGVVAITSHGVPLTLQSSPGDPVSTDPNATIAWSGTALPELKTDVTFKTFLGRGSGESIQMLFREPGFVIVQPSEESKPPAPSST